MKAVPMPTPETYTWVDLTPHSVLRVEGDSLTPEFPAGTILLMPRGEKARHLDIVAVRLADHGGPLVRRYTRQGNVVRLEALNGSGHSYEIDTTHEPGRLLWMKPVAAAQIPLSRRSAGNARRRQ